MSKSIKLLSTDNEHFRWIKPRERDHLLSRYIAVRIGRERGHEVIRYVRDAPPEIKFHESAITAAQSQASAIAHSDGRATRFQRAAARRVDEWMA